MKGKSVFITDAGSRRSLAAVRSLGRRGIRVTAGDHRRQALSFISRYCSRSVIYPSPQRTPDKFIDFLLDYLQSEKPDVFFPMSDGIVLMTARYRDQISLLTHVLINDFDKLEIAVDKAKTIRFARSADCNVPDTREVQDLKSLPQLAARIPYPAVIKPRVACGAAGLEFVRRPDELIRKYLRVHRRFPFPLIQEEVPLDSPKYGVQCLFNSRGELRSAAVQLFKRQFPLKAGPGSCFESVDRPDILKEGLGLLKKIGWIGPAQVEFMEDRRNGKLSLMEINPRFWDSLQLVIDAGLDFPYLMFRMAVEGDIEPQLHYQAGKICRAFLPGELLYFAASGCGLRTDPDFWRFCGPDLSYCIIRRDDMGPVWNFPRLALSGLFDSGLRDFVFRRR